MTFSALNPKGWLPQRPRKQNFLVWVGLLTLFVPILAFESFATEFNLAVFHQSISRQVQVRSPNPDSGGLRPLVIALHGHKQPVEKVRRELRLDLIADTEGFLIAYPSALDGRWNYGRPLVSPMPTVAGSPVDDAGFIEAVIDTLIAEHRVDPNRVFVAGVSRGALMTYALACSGTQKIAAIAPIISGMSDYQFENCNPARALPIVVVAGVADFVQWYDGRLLKLGRLSSIPETMEFWRRNNGCMRQSIRPLPNIDFGDRTRVSLVEWHECEANVITRLYKVWGGGHRVPSFAPPNPNQPIRAPRRSRDIETAVEIWSTFKQISVP